ncbi:MAG: hypothetical protein ACREOD_03440 [Candidatus Dormibacteria bacterium]
MAPAVDGGGDEMVITSSVQHRLRAALSAGGAVGLLFLPFGVVLGLLTHTIGWLVVFELSAALVCVTSFTGQRHNQVFVGPGGLRRVVQRCSLVASWPNLTRLEVKSPGNRVVSLTVVCDALRVQPPSSGGLSKEAQAMTRHPPAGFTVRMERAAADRLVAEVAKRRPGLSGLAEWDRASRPASRAGR